MGVTLGSCHSLHLRVRVKDTAMDLTEVIREHLVPFMKSHGTKVFMQDGAPCHRVRPVKDIIRDNGWTMIDWPGNSPDLNPIENLRNFMKDKLEELYLTNLPDLKREILRYWVMVLNDTDYCQKAVASMPRRLQAVIDAGGSHTKY